MATYQVPPDEGLTALQANLHAGSPARAAKLAVSVMDAPDEAPIRTSFAGPDGRGGEVRIEFDTTAGEVKRIALAELERRHEKANRGIGRGR